MTFLVQVMNLRWLLNFPASCLHAAEAVAHGRLVTDPRMAEAIAEPAQILRRCIVTAGLPRSLFWRNLTGLAPLTDNPAQLAELAITKTSGAAHVPSLAGELTAAIAGVESAVRRAIPSLMDDLELRNRPLREQWEAHGPGLLHRLAHWTDPQILVEKADIVLVHPSLGGGGSAHIAYNNVLLEAVLTNPVADLPELLRLAWLVSQLNLDLPKFCETIPGDHLPQVAELAMIPVTLRAAEDQELLRLTPETIDLRLNSWQVVTAPTWTRSTSSGAGGAPIPKRGRRGTSRSQRLDRMLA